MFGNRSADGELAVARLLTVTRTCQLQQPKAMATAAIRSHRRRHAVASLPPEAAHPQNCYKEALLHGAARPSAWL